MSESPSQPPEGRQSPSDAPLQDEHRVEPTAEGDEEIFDLADDEPAGQPPPDSPKPPEAGGTEGSAEWFSAKPGGAREGPFVLAEMQRRVTSGQLRPGDMVWCRGMSDWAPVREVGVLHGPGLAGAAPPPPFAGQGPVAGARLSGGGAEALLGGLDRFFSRPLVYRLIGRVCAVLGVLVGLVSLALFIIGWHWFTGALLFGLIFVVCEAAGAILEALERAAAQPRAAEKPGEPPA